MPNPDFVAEVRCNGQIYTGWKTVSVKRDYGTNAVTAFQFTAAEDTRSGTGWANLRVKPGDAVQIILGGIKVADGFVTTRQTAYDEKGHDIAIAGMSKTQDLVAGSMPLKQGSYHGQSFQQAANAATAGTGVSVVVKNPPANIAKPFASLNVDPGETRFQFIDKLARMRGLMMTDDKDGNLVCSAGNPTGQAVADLVEGVNILRARAVLDDQSAWSSYSMVGQDTGADAASPPRAVSASVTAVGTARAGRDRVVMAGHPGDSEDMKTGLALEVARSQWPVVQCSIVVVGWKRSDGKLWDVIDNVTVKSPMLFPNETGSLKLGVQSVTFLQDAESGTTTELELVKPEALSSLGHPGIQSDAAGNIVDSPPPGPAKADAPDYLPGGSKNTDAPL